MNFSQIDPFSSIYRLQSVFSVNRLISPQCHHASEDYRLKGVMGGKVLSQFMNRTLDLIMIQYYAETLI